MSRLPQIDVKVAAVKADADVVFVLQDGGKKGVAPKGDYSEIVQKSLKSTRFEAKASTTQYIALGGEGSATSLLLVGGGAATEATPEKMRLAGSHALSRLVAEKVESIQIHADSLAHPQLENSEALLHAFLEGFLMTAYRFDKYKKKDAEHSEIVGPKRITLYSEDKKAKASLTEVRDDVLSIAYAVGVTRDWSNEPSNYGTPEFYASEATRIAREHGIKCRVLGEKEALREKMGLFLSVSEGSTREAKIVVLDYNPKGAKKTVALVGKGVTFDSGGISIKPPLRMEEMKHDMTGAATLFGATLLAARRGVKNRIITILAFTENMPSGNATQPGNVITARNGKTVEIINTDAEGRLVLADVLDYAQDMNPDVIINAATLTGAVLVALGKQVCGIMGTNQDLIDQLRAAGAATHERMWQLPLYDEYFDDLKTDCADMKNSANDGLGGTIRGAIFLKQFIRKGVAWAHLDIAGTGYGMGHVPYYPKKGGSGMHVRAVADFVGSFNGVSEK